MIDHNYCLGFMFSKDEKYVLLCYKMRPDWQKNKLNGIGGLIENNETSLQAMQREFKEETRREHDDWKLFASIRREHYTIDCFSAVSDTIHHIVSATDEIVLALRIEDLARRDDLIPDLKVLIPLALHKTLLEPVFLNSE